LPENISGIYFFLGGGVGRGNPIAPVSYAYGWAPGPPPAKSGPAWQIRLQNLQQEYQKCNPAGSDLHTLTCLAYFRIAVNIGHTLKN